MVETVMLIQMRASLDDSAMLVSSLRCVQLHHSTATDNVCT